MAAMGVLGLGMATKFEKLTTKTLNRLAETKVPSVARQFIEDLSNRPELKQGERNLIRATLKGFDGAKVNVQNFINAVKAQLLPLVRLGKGDRTMNKEAIMSNRYESISLPDELRGPVANYEEHLYESPIKTSAGEVHFRGATDNYFAHTRIEDLPVQKQATSEWTFTPQGGGKYKVWNQTTGKSVDKIFDSHADAVKYAKSITDDASETRRVIELQSDLFQKGKLDKEYRTKSSIRMYEDGTIDMTPEDPLGAKFIEYMDSTDSQRLAKLEPYRNTWHERIIREEVAQAAKDGKTKLQLPTGETAMKIEGLVNRDDKWVTLDNKTVDGTNIKDGDIITFQTHEGGIHPDRRFLVTKNNGDGTFKAVDSLTAENDSGFYNLLEKKGALDDGRMPTLEELVDTGNLDVESRKYLDKLSENLSAQNTVDKNNPIFRFYEKEIGRYLTNQYGAKRITDPQGVEWWEVDVPRGAGNSPIEAFGAVVGITATVPKGQ
jgi:hypothetical protein